MSINSVSPNYSTTTVVPGDSEKTVSETAKAVEGQTESSSQTPSASPHTHHRHHHHKHHTHHKHHGGQTNPSGGRSESGTIPPPNAEMTE